MIGDAEDAVRWIVGEAGLAIDAPGAVAGLNGMLRYVLAPRLAAAAGELKDGAVSRPSLRTGMVDSANHLDLAREQLVERFGDTVGDIRCMTSDRGRQEDGGTLCLQGLAGQLPDGTGGMIDRQGHITRKDSLDNPTSAHAAMHFEFEACEEPNLRHRPGLVEHEHLGFGQAGGMGPVPRRRDRRRRSLRAPSRRHRRGHGRRRPSKRQERRRHAFRAAATTMSSAAATEPASS